MKLKLIVSPVTYGGAHPLIPPLGVALISNYLREKGIHVDQDDLDIKVEHDNKNATLPSRKVDTEFYNNKEMVDGFLSDKGTSEYLRVLTERILNKTAHKGFDLVGFSILWDRSYSANATTLSLAKLMKEEYGVPVIVGAYSFEQARHFIESGFVDYCVIGPGEEALLQLCGFMDNQKLRLDTIKGLIYKRGGTIIQNPGNYPNVCRFPDFDGLPLDLYRFRFNRDHVTSMDVRSNKSVLVLPYLFSIGCHSNCIFCSQSKSKYFEVKKVETVVTEIQSLVQKYQTPYFYFLNTNVNISYKYADNLFNAMQAADTHIFWTDSINFEHTDEQLLQKMKSNGAIRLLYGLESPNQDRLDYIRKKLTLSHATSVLKRSHELGIWNELYLIAGLPYESDSEVENTINFLKSNQEYINFIHLSRFRLMESELLSNPTNYGVENVRFIATEESKYCDFYTYAFDEKTGLKWEERAKKSEEAFNRINQSFRIHQTPFGHKYTSSNIHLLFYLYSLLSSKREVENAYIGIMDKYPEYR